MTALLAVDATGPWCAAALRDRAGGLRQTVEPMSRGQAERLAPMVQALLADAGLGPADLARVACATGPGSFAGARVGAAFVRGLALAVGAQAVGVSSLDVFARAADPERRLRLAVVLDIRRGEMIVRGYDRGQPANAAQRLTAAAAFEAVRAFSPDAVTGSGAEAVGGGADFIPVDPPVMTVLLTLAAEADPAQSPPSPFYARPPDADLPGAPR